MKTEIIVAKLTELTKKIGGTVRISKKGVPHIVVEGNNCKYSVAYFSSTNTFRVFWPYPSYGELQNKKTLAAEDDVARFLSNVDREEV